MMNAFNLEADAPAETPTRRAVGPRLGAAGRALAAMLTAALFLVACGDSDGAGADDSATAVAEASTEAEASDDESDSDGDGEGSNPHDAAPPATTASEPAESDPAESDPAETESAESEPEPADGGELFPDVLDAEFTSEGGRSFTVSVTLSSPYDSPERYADAWRVTDLDGNELGIRILGHDHANEQPFTRSQSGIEIPEGVDVVRVEGRDQVSGWGGASLEVAVPGE